MTGPFRSTLPRRLVAVAAATLALGAVGGLTTVQARQAPAVSPRNGAHAVTRAHAHRVGTSSPSRAAHRSSTARRSHGPLPLLLPHGRGRAASPPSASTPGAGRALAVRPQQSFNGLDAVDNKRASGFDLEPPDEGLGAGNGFVVNFVNVVGAVYRPSGHLVGRPFYLNHFFHEPAAANTSDPRVYYDSGARRWYATMVEYTFNKAGTTFTESHVDLAVSRSADPTGSWRVYRVPTSDLDHAGCPCLADFPILAFDHDNIYISTSEFTADQSSYNGAQIYAVSKSQAVRGVAHPNVVHFHNLAVDANLAGHVEGALTYGRAPAEYFVSSFDPTGTFGNQLAVWAMTGTRSVTTGRGSPHLSVRLVDSERYSFPPPARTPVGFCSGDKCNNGKGAHTTGLLQTNDDEAQEVQYINGVLVTTLDTGVQPAGDSARRSGIAWFVIRPSVSGGTVSPQTVVARQGYVSKAGQYLLFPHVDMTPNGSMAMVFGLTGPTTNPAAAYAVAPRAGRFGGVQVAANGRFPDHGFAATPAHDGIGRWGDYSNGQIVPGTQNVWLATQYIPNLGDGNENWGNRILKLSLP